MNFKRNLAMAVFLQSMLLILSFQEKLYSVPDGWNFHNNNSLPELPGDGRSGIYRPISALESGSNKQEPLALMLGARNSSGAAPVWLANRNNPVSDNSTLFKASDGRLKLLNTNGLVAWSSEKTVAYIGVEDTGNLRFYNGSQSSVFQLFDHPGNTLLANQKLITGQRLISNKNASDPAEGTFSSEVQSSGGTLYMSVDNKEKQPYLLWSFVGSKLSSPTAICTGYQTVISFTEAGELSMVYEPLANLDPSAQPCGSPLKVKLYPGNTSMRYFQLADDGSVNSYRRESGNGSWLLDTSDQIFLPPSVCGSYGLSEKNSELCKCLGDQPSNTSTSVPGKCSKPSWLSLENCSTKYETNFVTLAGATYFTNTYNQPDRTSAGVEECLGECRSDCSCAAFFYDQALQNCFFVKDVLGSLTLDPSKTQQLVGFLKYQNYSRLVPFNKKSSKTLRYKVIGVTSGVATIAIATFGLLFIILRRRNIMLNELNQILTGLEASPYRFSYSSLYLATSGFSKQLGRGGCGSVYEGTLHSGMKLAVKKLNTHHAQKEFITEVSALGSISHINVVKLFGFCADASHRILVYEFMPRGSLDKWIFNSSRKMELDWRLRYNIALGTARGLSYVHEKSRDSIIHLDIKPQNILLDDKFGAKVGDFGMAKLLMGREESGVVGYLAPEWLMHSIATKKCDVYSYGMVLLELIGGRKNLDCTKLESPLSWYYPAWAMKELQKGETMTIVDETISTSVEEAQAKKLIYIAMWCIQDDPGMRPTMDSVVQMLEGENEVDPPPLTFQFDIQAPGILSIISSDSDVPAFRYEE